MAETVASLASLLKLGANLPLQPPRFAKVTAVSGDTVTVSLGSGTADAVRCCACAVDDVVLLETMPSGTLAAVATKGASGGGGGGVESVTIGTVNGATFTNSGTAENVVLDLDVPHLTCTESDGGVPWDVSITQPSNSRGWHEEKWSDGRLTRWVWQTFYYNATTRNVTFSPFTGGTPFIDTPRIGLSAIYADGNAAATVGIKSYTYSGGADSIDATIAFFGTSNTNVDFCLRLDGHWN